MNLLARKDSPAARAFAKLKAAKPKRKKKADPLKTATHRLDSLLSTYVRERDKDQACIDLCGDPQGVPQAGHFRIRKHMSTRFDPRNVNKQWRACNYWRSDKNDLIRHERGIDARWGKGTAEKLFRLSLKTKQWTLPELTHLAEVLKATPERYEQEYFKAIRSK